MINLTEKRFRSYWDRTSEQGSTNERVRFRAVLELIEAEEPLRRSHTAKGYPKRIVEKFGDGKWHLHIAEIPVGMHISTGRKTQDEINAAQFGAEIRKLMERGV